MDTSTKTTYPESLIPGTSAISDSLNDFPGMRAGNGLARVLITEVLHHAPGCRLKTTMIEPARPPPAPLAHRDIVIIMTGLMVAMFPGALDATIIGPALPTIGRELGDAANLPWIVTAYLLVSTAATPLYGKLSDIHGRRVTLIFAIAVFALGSVLCALAPSMITLALARAVQAIGGGGLISVAMTVVGDIVQPRDRVRYQVFTSMMWTTASLLGPVLGGWFADTWGWRWMFWINLPLCLAAFAFTDSRLKRLPRNERPHSLDFPGAALLVAASTLFQLLLSSGGVRFAWLSWQIAALLAAFALTTTLLVWRLRTAREPLISYTLLSNNVVLTGAASVGIAMAAYVALSIYLPVYFEMIYGLTPSQSGFAMLPLMVCPTIGAMAGARALLRVRRYRRVPMAGMALAALALTPISVWPGGLPLFVVEALLVLVAVGVGAVFPVTTVSVQNAVDLHELGTATSLLTFTRSLGAAFGVALFGAISLLNHSSNTPAGALADANFKAVVENFRWMFFAGAVGFGLALLTISRMREQPLRDLRADNPPESRPTA